MAAYVKVKRVHPVCDHSVFVGKVVEVGLAKAIDGRADDATLWLKELGDKVFYGG